MYLKNLSLKAISAGSRSMLESLLAALANTGIQPVVSKVVPFDTAIDAWREIRDGDHIGKILIRIS
jgi:D-arabinose 1-dehydrogenase-like Zn-dependent alcohol dehydrogenase